MLQVYVFTAGGTTREVFNAVSAFMKTGSFGSIISISALCAALGCLIQYLQIYDLKILYKWFAVYFCVATLLVGVKCNVQIIDLSDRMNPYFVDNVPYGIAMPASIITSIEAGLTQGIEDVFHTPSDVTYATTGMLFGAQLFNAVNNGSILLNDTVKNDFNHFVRQCIVPDILINKKYSFEALSNTPDVLSFLTQQSMSPLRGIYINGQFQTCASALPLLSKEIHANVSDQTSKISTLLLGEKPISGDDLFSQVQNVYGYMMGMTDDAAHIIYQNTMINAIHEGIGTQIASNDSAAAMLNYGYTSAMQKQLLADNTLARVATYMLPLSQTVFILIMISVFPIVVMLAMQPMIFARTLKNYLGSLVYLATWPVLFCIINFIMTTELSSHMSSITQLKGGITLSNQNQLLYEAEQFAAYCGYLIALVPVLAGFIFKGLDSVFMHAAQTMMGNMQGWTSQTATALADGNVSLANSSVGNHSWNNWSANKHDSNHTDFSGMRTNQLGNAATVTRTPTGGAIYNTGSATSQLATSINAGEMISSQLSKNLDHSVQLAKQQSESFLHAVNQSWNDLSSLSNSHGIAATKGHNFAVSTQTSASEAASNIIGIVNDVAKSNKIHKSEAYQHLQNASLQASAEVGGSFGFPVVKIGASVGGKVGVSDSYSHSNSYGTSADQSGSVNISSNEQRQFSENYNVVKNASESIHTDHSSNASASQLSQLSSDFRKTDSVANQLSTTLSESNRYSDMLSYAKSNSADIKNNFSQAFAEHIQKTHPQEASELLSNTNNVAIAAKREALAESFIKNNYMNQFEKNFNARQQSQSSMAHGYQNESHAIANKTDRVVTNFMEQKDGIKTASAAQGITSTTDSQPIKNHVEDHLSAMNTAINKNRNSIEGENYDLTEKMNGEISTGKTFIANKRG